MSAINRSFLEPGSYLQFWRLKNFCDEFCGKIFFGFLAIKEPVQIKVIFPKIDEGSFLKGATFTLQKKLNFYCWK